MPFGLEIHMAAAHDPDIAKHLHSTQGGNEASSLGGERMNGSVPAIVNLPWSVWFDRSFDSSDCSFGEISHTAGSIVGKAGNYGQSIVG